MNVALSPEGGDWHKESVIKKNKMTFFNTEHFGAIDYLFFFMCFSFSDIMLN